MRFPLLRVAIQFENDISLARQRLQHIAGMAGFTAADRTRLVTALSEIARNAFQYAGEGTVEVFLVEDEEGQFLDTVVTDHGPGIDRLDAVMNGTYESRTGMGLGISGAKRLVDRFAIESAPGRGTVVTLGKRLRPGERATPAKVKRWIAELAAEAPRDVYELLQMQNQDLVGMMQELKSKERELDSQLKRAEQLNEELQAQKQQLEREIEHRQRVEEELVEARDAAESAARAKADFLANMSHEIRTPMNAVIGITRLLAEEPLGPQQRDFVGMIQSSGEALLAVINDILDFSKIEAGRLELEAVPVDLRGCVESALLLLAPTASRKGVELVADLAPDVPPLIMGDVTRLRQVLFNLIGNAVKFTPEGEVEVSVRRVEPQQREAASDEIRLRFDIRDSGIGISPERLEAIFEAFSQADSSTTRNFEGTGLGLTISRRLSEMMGGALTATSAGVPGQGATFSFEIQVPRADPAHAPGLAARVLQPEEALQGKRVLVVESNDAVRQATARLLAQWGVTVEVAASAAEALRSLEQDPLPDLALLDWRLPDMAGDALAGRLYTDGRLCAVARVLMKPFAQQSDGPSEQHATASVTKPCAARTLQQSLIRALAGPDAAHCTDVSDTAFDTDLGRRHPLRILLAEDNRINQRVALLTLERMSYPADLAVNGLEVLAALEKRPYDVILMDVHMPEMDGLDATRRVVATGPQGQRPRVIAMTASVLEEERHRCFEAGMDDWVSKPIDVDELAAALGRCPRLAVEGPAPEAASEAAPAAETAPAKPASPPAAETAPAPGAPLPADVAEAAENEPALDASSLAAYEQSLGGGEFGREFVLELIQIYREEAPESLDKIDAAVVAGDAEALRASAHALKGSSANLGAQRISQLCFALELLGKSGSTDGAADLFARVRARYDSLQPLLDAEVQKRC